MPLTPRQLEVLDFIVEFVQENRYAPTLQEMADEFDLSRVTVLQHLNALEEKGYLEREPNRARGITVTEQVDVPDAMDQTKEVLLHDSSVSDGYRSTGGEEELEMNDRKALPIIGHLSDRASVETREKPSYLPLGKLVPAGNEGFLLEVRSDQLAEYAILEGDMLVVDGGDSGTDGDLVLAEQDGTFVMLERNDGDGTSVLEPLEEGMENSVAPGEPEVRIKGTVTGVVRGYRD